LAFEQPRSLDTNGVVILDNSNLRIASSRNYHHFFPKDFLKKNKQGAEPNLIANITLIDGYSNKHRIGAKAPSSYIAEFHKDNKNILETLNTHLIRDANEYGVWNDDYGAFISKRARTIA